MDNQAARKILADNKVETCWDPRPAEEILHSMIEKGHLPASVLGAEIYPVATEVPVHDQFVNMTAQVPQDPPTSFVR